MSKSTHSSNQNSQVTYTVLCDNPPALAEGKLYIYSTECYSGNWWAYTSSSSSYQIPVKATEMTINSLKIGTNTKVRVCPGTNFSGGCSDITSNQSYQVVKSFFFYPAKGCAVFFRNANFSGDYFHACEGYAGFKAADGFTAAMLKVFGDWNENDSFSSVIPGIDTTVKLWQKRYMTGESVIIKNPTAHLSDYNFNDRTSSFEINS